MPNICVKNVYTQRINFSIPSGYISTKPNIITNNQPTQWVKGLFIQPFILFFTHTLSTTKKLIFNLLNKSFTHNPQHLLMRLIKEN